MVKVCLSHERAITPISDPIHTRFEFNVFEREFIDSPYFQRLHFILQNSVSYATFPANKNTRFPHSLGVAHVCGLLFSNGLKKSKYVTLNEFLQDAAKLIEDIYSKLKPRGAGITPGTTDKYFSVIKTAHKHTIAGQSGFVHFPLFSDKDENGDILRVHTEQIYGKSGKFEAIFVIDTLWQALRLYALMHDVGHLPMSHAFEVAINNQAILMSTFGADEETKAQYGKLLEERKLEFTSSKEYEDELDDGNKVDEEKAYITLFSDILNCSDESIRSVAFDKDFHEVRGLSLFNKFIRGYESTFGGSNGSIEIYANLVHHIALCIFFSSAMDKENLQTGCRGFLLAMKALVDGELDGDRMDYTLRDGHESGSDIGKFDLTRIVSNAMLVSTNGERRRFIFGYYIRALSGIEQFFEQRFQSYKYIIYHRTSNRANTCLERLIAQIIHHAFRFPDREIADAFEDFGYISRFGGKITSFLPDKEEDLFRIDDANLRTLFLKIYRILDDKESVSWRHSPKNDKELIECEIFNLIQVVIFRNYTHIIDPLKKISAEDFIRKQRFGFSISSEDIMPFIRKLISQKLRHVENLQERLNKKCAESGFGQCAVLVTAPKPKLFDAELNSTGYYEKQVVVVDESGTVMPISKASAMLATMNDRREPESYAKIYLVSENIKFDKTKYKHIIKIINEYLQECIVEYLKLNPKELQNV